MGLLCMIGVSGSPMLMYNPPHPYVGLRPAKKKGYGNFLGNDTGPGTVDIMGDALSQSRFAEGDVDPDNEMDGFGALTGAIDQLAFTHDLDFSGDGIDEDPLKPKAPGGGMMGGVGPGGNSLAPPNAQPEKKKKKKKRDLDGHNNPAFLDDEELLLAAALSGVGGTGGGGGGGESDDSDTDMLEARRLARPRIVIQAETEAAATGGVGVPAPTAAAKGKPPAKAPGVAAKDPKKTPTTPVPDLGRPRMPSAKIRRIGSARKTPARFTMTFTEKYDVVTPSPGVPQKQISGEGLSAAHIGATDKGRKESKDKTKDKAKDKAKEDKTKVVEEEEPSTSEDQESGDKWAEKKSRHSSNKVAPSDAPEASGDSRARDDLSVGLESGADSTREEVRAKERERPKTSVASQKMNRRATKDVGNMNSILPWDNEDGDIK